LKVLSKLRVRICPQVSQNLAMAGLWVLITVFMMLFLPMPAVAIPVVSHAIAVSPADSMSISITSFGQSKSKARFGVNGNQQVLEAYQNQQSNVIVENVSGVVEAILPDDVEGSQHQRFILQLEDQQTVLIVHNVDIAPRIVGLQEGDRISVKGEYEWNDRGGLIHWTHRDPRGSHADGWIEHDNIRYE
jgi:hypothetical protein